MPRTIIGLGALHALQLAYARAATVEEKKLQLAKSLGISWPLERRSLWPMKAIQQNPRAKNISTNIDTNDGMIDEGGSTH